MSRCHATTAAAVRRCAVLTGPQPAHDADRFGLRNICERDPHACGSLL